MRVSSLSSMLALALILLTLGSHCYGSKLKVGYYMGKCGGINIEKIIYGVVKEKIADEPDVVSDLVRMSFHDCFVRGCDASLFLEGKYVEQSAKVNQGLGGIDDVHDIKEAVEKVCPGVVSCADILHIAARAAIYLAGGKWYDVETGRKDGYVSRSSEAEALLPPPTIPLPQAIELFAKYGLSKHDFVVLLGGHTVGTAHCHSFKERMYNYKGTNKPDPSISYPLYKEMQKACYKADNETFLDQTSYSHFKIDNDYYKQILAHNGTLEIDENLASSPLTRGIVKGLAKSPYHFLNEFGPAMVKMARIGVLTGHQGQVRKNCRYVNY